MNKSELLKLQWEIQEILESANRVDLVDQLTRLFNDYQNQVTNKQWSNITDDWFNKKLT